MSKHESAIICIALILSGIVFYIGKSYGLLNIVWVFLPLFAIVWIRLVVMNIDVLYYSFIASLFVSRPLVNLFPITIVLPDLLFILLMAHQLYIYNKNAVWYDFHKKVGIPLFLLCMAALLSVFLNVVAGYRPIVIATGFWSVWRLAQVLLLYMIFSAKNVTRLSLEKVMILFGVMLLIQLVFIAAGYNGTFFSHHASMGTFMFLPIFLSVGVLYKKHISFWLKCNAAVVFVLAFIVHLLSESRSAFAGIGLGLMLIGFRMHLKNIRSVLLFAGILFGISYLLLNTPLGGILDKTFKDGGQLDISSLSRFVIWESAWKFWLNQDLLHKFFGTGITFSRELLPIPF
ncbi:MAG: O-antigen ligase family protein, partial [Fibrobacterota bacterium]